MRRRARLRPAFEGLDDAHAPAAAGARRAPFDGFGRFDGLGRWRRHGEEFSGARYLGLARGTCEQAVVTNAVEALWQDMEQESPNELVRGEHHDALPLRTLAAVSL